jgi:hypothetical protein
MLDPRDTSSSSATPGPRGALELQLGSGGDDDFSVTGPAHLAGKLSLRDLNGLRPLFDLNLFFGFPVTGTFSNLRQRLRARLHARLRRENRHPQVQPVGPEPGAGLRQRATLHRSRVAEPYTFTFSATGLARAQVLDRFGIRSPGITLASNGVLSGTPMAVVGTYEFIVRASNGVPPDATQPVNFELTPGWPASLEIEGGGVQSATVNHAFGQPLRSSCATRPPTPSH